MYGCVGCSATFTERNPFCSCCGASTSLTLLPESPGLVAGASGSAARSLPELLARTRRVGVLTGEWEQRLGSLPSLASILIYGGPGAGKSTLAVQLSGAFADAGRTVLYVGAEEGHSPSLLERFQRAEVVSDRISVLAASHLTGVLFACLHGDHQSIVIDSVSAVAGLLPTHVALISQQRQEPLVLVAQGTKGGQAAGPQALQHLVDIVIEVEAGVAIPRKNRFGALAQFDVFPAMDEVTL